MTRAVKVPPGACWVENVARVNYNVPVSTARILGHFTIFAMCAPLLMGGACEKKTNQNDTGAINALDRTGSGSETGPLDSTPLQGIDISKLAGDATCSGKTAIDGPSCTKTKLFYRLLASLKSPCGKSHSLRTSYTTDTACKRAPFAVRYITALIEDEATEDMVREEFTKKYESVAKAVKLDVGKAPRIGNDDAPVRIVEFFDYACPHCAEFKGQLDEVAAKHQGQLVEYFMMFPLGKKEWPHSKSAAQASIAANAQGKFKEMHALLFASAPAHSQADVMGYAKQLGLDVAKFEQAYTAAAAQVEMDKAQGDGAGVQSTPGVFFNDRKYEGPLNPRYLSMWIEEEIAVNR